MKVALVCNYSEPFGDKRTGGLITSAIHLSRYGFVPVFVGPKRASHIPGFTYYNSAETMQKDFDFFIFSSPGSIDEKIEEYWIGELQSNRITKPFAVQSHRETDPGLFKRAGEYFAHPKFAFFMPICKDLWEEMPEVDTFPYLAHQSEIKKDWPIGSKRDWKIVSSSRLTSAKRIHELARQYVKGIKFMGKKVAVDIWGAESSYFYTKALNEIAPGLHKGIYKNAERNEFLHKAVWHWNCYAFKRGTRIAPRLELASIEAAAAGCRLIVQKSSTPKEYWHAVTAIDALDPKLDLSRELKEQEGDPWAFMEVFNALNAGKEDRLMKKIRSVL